MKTLILILLTSTFVYGQTDILNDANYIYTQVGDFYTLVHKDSIKLLPDLIGADFILGYGTPIDTTVDTILGIGKPHLDKIDLIAIFGVADTTKDEFNIATYDNFETIKIEGRCNGSSFYLIINNKGEILEQQNIKQ